MSDIDEELTLHSMSDIDEELTSHSMFDIDEELTACLTNLRQYETLAKEMGAEPFCWRVMEANNLIESCLSLQILTYQPQL